MHIMITRKLYMYIHTCTCIYLSLHFPLHARDDHAYMTVQVTIHMQLFAYTVYTLATCRHVGNRTHAIICLHCVYTSYM